MHLGIRSHFGSSSNRTNNLKKKWDLKATCQCSGSGQLLSQDDPNNRHQFLSLYLPIYTCDRTELIIFDTESDKNEVKIFDTQLIDESTSITQLPNGELFCYGKSCPEYGITLIIDRSYGVRMLPSGAPSSYSSTLYFDSNIYCFGGYNKGEIALSRKFDLEKSRWINLALLPRADYYCHSVIFNGNILISSFSWNNLWLYSIEIDSFSTIPYDFAYDKRKFLINLERLYLIEWDYDGFIYESDNEYDWIPISKSQVFPVGSQMYCLFNKEKIYIATYRGYCLLDLKKKALFEIKKENYLI